jgi:hypothetical protein
MPKLSDTMTVGTLVKWKKNEGEAVKSGDCFAEVETVRPRWSSSASSTARCSSSCRRRLLSSATRSVP